MTEHSAATVSKRLPSYFVYSLQEEWAVNKSRYSPLVESIQTPFTIAAEREAGWSRYAALLSRRAEASVFAEPFSLRQVYIPLNAWYEEAMGIRKGVRQVVPLEKEIRKWLRNKDRADTMRVLSGGPGSGKSSFARVFAADYSAEGNRVLLVPLHLINPTGALAEEVTKFTIQENILSHDPLDPRSPEQDLLIIFDGLDELSSRGHSAAETARSFVKDVERLLQLRNSDAVRLRVLLCGRELIVQENELEFRRDGNILYILPYEGLGRQGFAYEDGGRALVDLRNKWWKNYGSLTGRLWEGMPDELRRDDLDEITIYPLLNYLVAFSYSRDLLKLGDSVSLNTLYGDMIRAVYSRAYDSGGVLDSISHMTFDEFQRVLEEVAISAWQDNSRTTTTSEIERRCAENGLTDSLTRFQIGAEAGATNLLAAFFFRRYNGVVIGERTFVFTHKTFGEFLTACRIVRAISRVSNERQSRATNVDSGWDERDALAHWISICGTGEITLDLLRFVKGEIGLRAMDEVEEWQRTLSQLFGFVLRNGMPMERMQTASFTAATASSRNAERALFLALNLCAEKTALVSEIGDVGKVAMATWLRQVLPLDSKNEFALLSSHFSYLPLRGQQFECQDCTGFFFKGTELRDANFRNANLEGADFRNAHLSNAKFEGAILRKANFEREDLSSTLFSGADLQSAKLSGAFLQKSDCSQANLKGADMTSAILVGTNLRGANLDGADLQGARLKGAIVTGASFRGANLQHSDLGEVDFSNVDLRGANLGDADLAEANFIATVLDGVRLSSSQIEVARNLPLAIGKWIS